MLDRREFLTLSAAAAASLTGLRRAAALPFQDQPAPAFVIDALGSPGGTSDGPLTAEQIADVRASGLTAVNLTVGAVGVLANAFEETVKGIASWEQELAAHPDVLLKVRSAADLQTARDTGRLGLIYGFQDTLPLGDDLDRMETFYNLGVRIIQLTYNRRNLAGDGCLEPADAGLSRLGHAMVERMNQRGILVDLGHSGRRTALDAIEASKGPVAITHTGCAALADLPRNKTDEELRRLADKGGVAGIYLMPFLRTKGQPMAEDVIRHIEHAVQVCGEDHVGIGTDGGISAIQLTPEYIERFRKNVQDRRRLGISAPGESEDVYTFVPDLNTPRRFELIGRHLLDRGHSEARVAKILGGNFARLFRETWART
ncbi:MAG TPA: membrane dipeptidase [Thermoanaerobaculia bacterium]|nr:membrane dipeptidase [Thermoanaerobaculia bacterium]